MWSEGKRHRRLVERKDPRPAGSSGASFTLSPSLATQAFAPKYEFIAEHFHGEQSLRVAAFDCVRYK